MADPGPPAASAENAFAANLFEDLPARYDRLAEVLSLGQNAKWRHELVHHIARTKPGRVLDVATGTASVAIALEVGRKRVDAVGLDRRIRLQHARAEQLPFPSASFDAVSFTYLLRYVADPAATLRELGRVLRPGGAMAGLDFYIPPGVFWRMSWRLYTRAVMPGAGFVLGGRAWWNAGRFLGPNIEAFYRQWPIDRLFEAWREAGIVA